MPPTNPWTTLKDEVERLRHDGRYKALRPLLDTTEALIGAGPGASDADQVLALARAMIAKVHQVREKTDEGADLVEAVSQVSSGFVQPGMEVNGVVNQANRDVNTVIINAIDRKRDELERTAPSQAVPVPVVLVVMTSAEALQLADGSAFDGFAHANALRTDFEPMVDLLTKNGRAQWADSYQDKPEGWRPSGAKTPSIADLVTKALDYLNANGISDRPLRPDFKDVRQITIDKNRPELKRLRTSGCVVIVDSISIRHPQLLREYHHSMLDAYPRTSIVRLAPLASAIDLVRKMTFAVQWGLSEMEFDRRRVDLSDEYTCMDISDFDAELPKWLVTQVKKLLPAAASAPSGILREIKNL